MSAKPDLIEVIHAEGLQLRRQGRNYIGLCPFHTEKHPSFAVSSEHQKFKCYGCGAYGDVISFVMQYKKISFKDALAYLRIRKDIRKPYDPVEARKKDLIRVFRRWIFCNYDAIAREYRGLNNLLTDIRTIEDLELRAWIFHELPVLEYHMDILQYADDETKFELFNEVMTSDRF
ncbi:MAG TPA: CHC2 zinc finger domain-containing protein [Syntrophales bacterium]|nr:CHC2 zinc finger domain-containing protein [Syntrophales bacterium]HPI58077.1 CHC2 zinc finger domain-containing protein [Syntrophales bacterium]HPN25293.1 CHC2 zinc finger domain-containing protein [Syntrophales bacterium]HQM29288.1 CHC2 zinc finger domain-containing protein [Syntrophales bacterium]